MKNTKISIMPHTHWDREWYFTYAKSLVYSLHNFKEVIDYLMSNNEYKYFLLDAQVSLIEDYLKYYEEDIHEVKNLISEGRLIVGPWYTQTDTLVISGESIVRNLYYGIKGANKLGKSMMVGYLPDSFGQSAQLPQIYNGFSIDKTAFRRGMSTKQIQRSEFYWNGPANTRVYAHNIVDYGNMINPPLEKEEIKKYFNNKIEELGELSDNNQILLMNGQDQRPIRKDLLEIIKRAEELGFNIEISNLEKVLEEMKSKGNTNNEYTGEFTFGQKSRVHKSIFSTRADLKTLNNKAENYITNILEPMCTIAYSLGNRYNHKLIEKIWKMMFENAAHDSIGMCNSDKVNDEIENRFKKVNDFAASLFEINGRLIAQSIPEKDVFQFQVYNYLPYSRSGVVRGKIFTPGKDFKIIDGKGKEMKHHIISTKDVSSKIRKDSTGEIGVNGNYKPLWKENNVEIFQTDLIIYIEDVPALGYKTLYFENCDKRESPCYKESKEYIENEFIKVKVNENGTVCITNKLSKKELEGLFILENAGDDGDTYDYSEPFQDRIYLSNSETISDIKIDKSELCEAIYYKIKMDIPYDLEERIADVRSINIDISVKISVLKGSDKVNFEVNIDNKAIEHRFRALFKTNIPSNRSIADQQFGTIERNTYLSEVEIWEKEQWVEKPRTIEPMQSFVTLRNEDYGLAVFTDGVREYQIIGDKFDTIALTLFRSVPYMGKSNLKDRPGRASGMEWETPKAKLLKKMKFSFTVDLYNKKSEGQLLKESKELFTPLTLFQSTEFMNNFEYFIINKCNNRNTEYDYSMLKFENNSVILSGLKKKEDGEGYILRLFNGELSKTVKDKIILEKNINEVALNEVDIKRENVSKIELMPCEVKTFAIDK